MRETLETNRAVATPSISRAADAENARLKRILEGIYDKSVTFFDQGRATEAVEYLIPALAAARLGSTAEDWKESVERLARDRLHDRFLVDPYIVAARTKSRGYAGDAHTLDFVYGHREPPPQASALTKELLKLSTGAPIAAAVRTRAEHIAGLIEITLQATSRAVIVSVACGHMRELHQVSGLLSAMSTIEGYDQDQDTIRELGRLHGDRVGANHCSVREIIAGTVDLPRADLIYATGLYDYLEDRVAIRLTQRLMARLSPGGTVVILNITPANEEIAFMEAIMDWWMIYRDTTSVRTLCRDAMGNGQGFDLKIYDIADGRVACATITRSMADHSATNSGIRSAV